MTIDTRMVRILDAFRRGPQHTAGIAESAKVLRDWIWVVTGQMITVDQSEEIARDMHRAYVAEQL